MSPVAIVLTAMPDEARPFLEAAGLDPAATPGETLGPAGSARRHRLTLAGRDVVLVRTGIGQVNAATALVRALVDDPDAVVVSAGSAGGLAQGVHVGDVVVGTAYSYASADATAFGYELGQVPGMPVSYTGAPDLLAACTDVVPELADLTVRTGPMLSGDSFITAANVDVVRERFPDALATDMETTALAQAAFSAGVPFVSVRGISDLCGPAGADDFLTHVDDAADRSARVVLAALDRLARA